VLTHCNAPFARVSGYSMEELMGQPHNLIRHPDMPPEAYKDMWATIGRGRSWTGFVKNRRKNGDFYWVQATSPHHARGQAGGLPVGAHQAHARAGQAAEALYARVKQERESGRQTIRIHAGGVRSTSVWDNVRRAYRWAPRCA
jgi:aerotaxis receptor